MIRDKPLHNFLFEMDENNFFKDLNAYCTPWIDVCCILSLIKYHKPKNLLEIGTHYGHTTKIISDKFPELKITTIDPGDKVQFADRSHIQQQEYLSQDEIGKMFRGNENINLIKEDFHQIDFKETFDFIFIDGDHTYPAVINDTKKSLSLLNPKGVIIWHDWENVKDVNAALNEFNLPNPIVYLHNTWIAYYES
jgi:predicted O-methyltransferase YrrM